MSREELVIRCWNEILRHKGLRFWKPPNGCRLCRSHIGHYTRLQAIDILEDALTKRLDKSLELSGDDSLTDALEAELMMLYGDLDGVFDHLPLTISCAPKIVQNLMPEMLVEYLKQWADDSAIIGNELENSIVKRWLLKLTKLRPEQLMLGKESARLIVPDVAGDSECVYLLILPDWLREVNELVLLDWRPGGLRNVRQLRAYLKREIKNSTWNIGNSVYR